MMDQPTFGMDERSQHTYSYGDDHLVSQRSPENAFNEGTRTNVRPVVTQKASEPARDNRWLSPFLKEWLLALVAAATVYSLARLLLAPSLGPVQLYDPSQVNLTWPNDDFLSRDLKRLADSAQTNRDMATRLYETFAKKLVPQVEIQQMPTEQDVQKYIKRAMDAALEIEQRVGVDMVTDVPRHSFRPSDARLIVELLWPRVQLTRHSLEEANRWLQGRIAGLEGLVWLTRLVIGTTEQQTSIWLFLLDWIFGYENLIRSHFQALLDGLIRLLEMTNRLSNNVEEQVLRYENFSQHLQGLNETKSDQSFVDNWSPMVAYLQQQNRSNIEAEAS